MPEQGPVALYDSLARFQWWRRTWARAAPGDGLEMRKRLKPSAMDGPSDGGAGLDQWLMKLLGAKPRHRILDLGCGFGASLLRWLPADAKAHAFGITPSRYQVRRAQQVAKQLGAAARCTFLLQSLEADLPADLDVVLAIEALGHTQNLPNVLRHIQQSLQPGGTLVWLEDLTQEPAHDDPDVLALARHWSSPPLHNLVSVREELQAAGLQLVTECDLTTQVPHRTLPQIARSQAAVNRWRRLALLPFARHIAQAFAGGFALERLYARGIASYRVLLATPCEATP